MVPFLCAHIDASPAEDCICVLGTNSEAGSCTESALKHSSSADYQDVPLCHWPSELVASADTRIRIHDAGGEAGAAHNSDAQGAEIAADTQEATLIQSFFTVAEITADTHQSGALIQPSIDIVGTAVMIYAAKSSCHIEEGSAKSLHLPSDPWNIWTSTQNVNCSCQDMQGLLCKAKESTMTMGINWDMVDPAKGSQAGWDIMSSEDSEEIAVSDVRLYVNISNNFGVLWVICHAEMCIHPVEAWWAGMPNASLPTKLDCVTDGVTNVYSEDAQMLNPPYNGLWLPYLLALASPAAHICQYSSWNYLSSPSVCQHSSCSRSRYVSPLQNGAKRGDWSLERHQSGGECDQIQHFICQHQPSNFVCRHQLLNPLRYTDGWRNG